MGSPGREIDRTPLTLWTIGHSNHPIEAFAGLLIAHSIDRVVDVRSAPYSRRQPQFNRETLERALHARDRHYTYLGDALGGRRAEPEVYESGHARYDRIVRLPAFQAGLEQVRAWAGAGERVALMCAERDPVHCHRMLLVARCVRKQWVVEHIDAQGGIESMPDAEARMVRSAGMSPVDLFRDAEAMVESAYAALWP